MSLVTAIAFIGFGYVIGVVSFLVLLVLCASPKRKEYPTKEEWKNGC